MSEKEENQEGKDPWVNNPQVKETDNPNWEKEVIANLAMGALTEQRRARKWNLAFKFSFLAYLLIVMAVMWFSGADKELGTTGKHTALVELRGVIADDSEASADNIVTGLRKAFDSKNTVAVIMRINSPGGSPVQSGYINDEIKRLRGLHPDIPLYAVITDMCASGGYYIASAADKIYADKASIVGSIGVVMGGFGFVDAMDKLGIERRMLTAGEHKGFLDPFSPMKDSDKQHIHTMLNNIHQQFINVVREGRGDRLKETENMFSGLVWTGEQSVELGLVDGLGSASYVAREIIGEEDIVDYTPKPDPLHAFAEKFGVTAAKSVAEMAGFQSTSLR